MPGSRAVVSTAAFAAYHHHCCLVLLPSRLLASFQRHRLGPAPSAAPGPLHPATVSAAALQRACVSMPLTPAMRSCPSALLLEYMAALR
jgi:hypothetical protein